MKKRSNSVVILSSSDDDDNNKTKNCSNSKPIIKNSKSKPKPRTSAKKSRISHSLSESAELFSTFDDLKFLSEDFAGGFSGFKVPTGSRRPDGSESWVDKHRPRSLEELAVHKKKVDEVKNWFEEKLTNLKQDFQNYVLLITGQAGIGKSASVYVIASHLGAEVCEWNTPTPTIWQEHVHNSNAGMRYMSKLDEFENFVERVRKYGILSSSFTDSRRPMILLIEDLPLAHGKIAQGKLHRCLQLLVKSVKIPTVILITDYSGSDSADVSMRFWDELSSSLESAGACKVAFNPITMNSIKKVLSRICRQEHRSTTCEQIDFIANASGGDIRHAIMTLQYSCLIEEENVISTERCAVGSETKALSSVEEDASFSLPLGRDQTLSLFHALGKFLHNKRETDCPMADNEDGFYLKEGFTRLPLKMEAPEKVLCQAYGQARPVAEFLHENVLDFLSQEAIEDAWAVTSYLSDADCLLSSGHRAFARNYEAENIIQSAAASVSVRGVLFGNAHPSPSRWHSIRRPTLWQVEKSARRNMHEMERQRLDLVNGLSLSDVSIFGTEFRPALKWLGYRASSCFEHPDADNSSMLENELEGDELYKTRSLDQAESTDDEIEFC